MVVYALFSIEIERNEISSNGLRHQKRHKKLYKSMYYFNKISRIFIEKSPTDKFEWICQLSITFERKEISQNGLQIQNQRKKPVLDKCSRNRNRKFSYISSLDPYKLWWYMHFFLQKLNGMRYLQTVCGIRSAIKNSINPCTTSIRYLEFSQKKVQLTNLSGFVS